MFGFWSAADDWVLVLHADGDRARVTRIVGVQLNTPVEGFDQLDIIANVDSDAEAGSAADGASAYPQSLLQHVTQEVDADARIENGVVLLSDGTRFVHPVVWRTPDPPSPGLPSHQCLERLVCAAQAEAFPDRARTVDAWLTSRVGPPYPSPKEHAWSCMAGWYAAQGCDDFWQALWRDAAIRNALESRLEMIGATASLRRALGVAGPATDPEPAL